MEDLYCADNGRPSIDPVVIFKMVLIQHLYGLPSLRRTVEEIKMNVAYRWFLGYLMNEQIPHFSTVSYNFKHRYTEKTIEEIINDLDNPYISGLSILGGEPLEYENQKGILPLVKKVKEIYPDKNIWCYTGFTFDKDVIGGMCNKWKETKELISYIDVVVDGKFEEDKKSLSIKFRGSTNQRIIDVKKSLKEKNEEWKIFSESVNRVIGGVSFAN